MRTIIRRKAIPTPLHIEEPNIKTSRGSRLSYLLLRKIPFYHKLRGRLLQTKSVFRRYGFVFLILICCLTAFFIWMDSYETRLPPGESMAVQANLINTCTLLTASFVWGVIIKYRRIQIPRNKSF